MASPTQALPNPLLDSPLQKDEAAPSAGTGRTRTYRPDLTMLGGILLAIFATVAGIAATGIRITYFLQPTGALIVLGGTLGVALITTPKTSLFHALQRVGDLLHHQPVDREALIEEIASHARAARTRGILGLETAIPSMQSALLREALALAMEVPRRNELRATLEMQVRLEERQAETDAKVLETAGGFAPTIGVIGTVVGLIDVMRQFSDMASVTLGIGVAFVSTIYGLTLANLLLLPAAHRIRAIAADHFETREMVMEGVMCLFDGMHPSMLRERLNCFVRTNPVKG